MRRPGRRSGAKEGQQIDAGRKASQETLPSVQVRGLKHSQNQQQRQQKTRKEKVLERRNRRCEDCASTNAAWVTPYTSTPVSQSKTNSLSSGLMSACSGI